MPSSKGYRSPRSAYASKPSRTAWKVTEKAATGLARWATTDHTGTAKMLAERPTVEAMCANVTGIEKHGFKNCARFFGALSNTPRGRF